MSLFKNERNTENLVRDGLRRLGYFDGTGSEVVVEEQRSKIESVKKLMRASSKSGQGGPGAPEFIISSANSPDFLAIVECKADPKDLISDRCRAELDGISLAAEPVEEYARRTQRFAVDGVLHYARRLAKEFNVIAVAVCGESTSSVIIATYLVTKGTSQVALMKTKTGAAIEQLLRWDEYIEDASYDSNVQNMRSAELLAFSRDLHDFMRDHAKLTEYEKPLVVSGTLLALRNKAFAVSYGQHSPAELQDEWYRVIAQEIQKAVIPQAKKDKMVQPYSAIAAHPELGKATKSHPRGVLYELIRRLNDKVWPFIEYYHDFDVVGQFYGEFLKYTGGDKKALGIVLTPRHVTELFALIANVHRKSRVLDICAGTGGFLISAMHQMMKDAVTSKDEDRIRRQGLVGVEQLPGMFALAASNMILRGDGKANLYQGSCFDEETVKQVKGHSCDVGMINPPFSQRDTDLHELYFVKQMLDCLKEHGVGIAIAPVSCAISPHPARAELLKRHTLEAVMSLPDELFYPVGTVTCMMVFTAGIPHTKSNRKTWFGYWKDDGFIKTKNRGRIDLHNRWASIRDGWVDAYRNREVYPGESITQRVTANDEWCAEAYMEADYSKLDQEDFERVVKNYAIFRLMGAKPIEEAQNDDEVE